MGPAQYVRRVESTIAKAPRVRFLQISPPGPYDHSTTLGLRHFLQVIQRALSSLSKLSGLDLQSYQLIEMQDVLSVVVGIPQLRAFRCSLLVSKLPTINPPLLPRLEVLSVCFSTLVGSEGGVQELEELKNWLRRWRMPCLTQFVSTGDPRRTNWSWILDLLEYNGAHLKVLNPDVSLRAIPLTAKPLTV